MDYPHRYKKMCTLAKNSYSTFAGLMTCSVSYGYEGVRLYGCEEDRQTSAKKQPLNTLRNYL